MTEIVGMLNYIFVFTKIRNIEIQAFNRSRRRPERYIVSMPHTSVIGPLEHTCYPGDYFSNVLDIAVTKGNGGPKNPHGTGRSTKFALKDGGLRKPATETDPIRLTEEIEEIESTIDDMTDTSCKGMVQPNMEIHRMRFRTKFLKKTG